MKIVVTGAAGLLGRHAAARVHARNRAAAFRGETEPFDLVRVDRATFADADRLRAALTGADVVLHFAGVNRASEEEIATGNPTIAEALVAGCRDTGASPHVVYADSTHSKGETVYGRSKRRAGEILAAAFPRYTGLILPHIFGELARPDYNNVTATFIDRVIRNEKPQVNASGRVQLLHAGAAADIALTAALDGTCGVVEPAGRDLSVVDLLETLTAFHDAYSNNTFPDLADPFDAALFNSYRQALYPDALRRPLKMNTDARGVLFEAARGGGGGQTFLSWTHPGITRGNHFHLNKVERFLVLKGDAVIRIRRVLDETVWELRVSGDEPTAVDMPTLHTHSIENVGDEPLLTLFWTHEVFDPAAPDTYADPVLRG